METPNENLPNEQHINQQFSQQFNPQTPGGGAGMPLPNATAVLVLGIISIAMCWCYGIIGLTCGIIALVLANKSLAIYKTNPATFSQSSYKNLNAGRICAIIGTILSGLYAVFIIVYLIIFGTVMSGALGAGFPKF
ncbi:MAG: CCC motif membrane protein [Sediminibacterium sp.]|nr:CCC motif membrane protein [Sediminibacterium sp.]